MLNISVNNNSLIIDKNCNLTQLIDIAGFSNQTIAIAINGEFIPKSQYLTTELNCADKVDIVKPIGGG